MTAALRGTVIATTRRYVELTPDGVQSFRVKLTSGEEELAVGDRVSYSGSGDSIVLDSCEERTNCLTRAYGSKIKTLVANADRVLIVAAPRPLFNTMFIDRILAAAGQQHIPCVLAINKIDLSEDFAQSEDLFAVYQNIGVDIIYLSAHTGEGLEALRAFLENDKLSIIALAGLSGVGKSSLLNQLIPGASARTQDVSERSGQGKQTTTRAFAHTYKRASGNPLYLVDLPGIQNYGVTHLDEQQVEYAFVEFSKYRGDCQFANCTHTVEPDCGVLRALQAGDIAKTRYQSYLHMLEEIKAAKPY